MTNTDFTTYVPRRTLLVWLAIVSLTVATSVIGTRNSLAPTVVTAAVLAFAFVKVRLVGSHFMELRSAPRGLRAAFDAYLGSVYAALVVLYVAM